MSYIDSPDARVWAIPHGAREVASNTSVGGALGRDPFFSPIHASDPRGTTRFRTGGFRGPRRGPHRACASCCGMLTLETGRQERPREGSLERSSEASSPERSSNCTTEGAIGPRRSRHSRRSSAGSAKWAFASERSVEPPLLRVMLGVPASPAARPACVHEKREPTEVGSLLLTSALMYPDRADGEWPVGQTLAGAPS
jgi:hypothetical protein